MLLAPDHGLLFIHCPKCAGTSIKVALAAALGIDRPAILRAYGLAEHGTLAEARERLPAGLWKRLTVIGTMRDPLQRLASFWRFGRAAGPDGSRAFKGFGGRRLPPDTAREVAALAEVADLEDWVALCCRWNWDPWWQTRRPGRSVIERAQAEWFGDWDKPVELFDTARLGELEAWLALRGIEVRFGGENESAGPVPEIGPKVRAWAADVYARDYQRLGRHAQGSDRHRNG